MSKILILGAKGMLGCDLAEVFKNESPVLWDKEDLDITNKDLVTQKLLELKPDIVINAAAYTAVDDCETNRELAVQVNGFGAGYVAQACKENGALLVHYSTDYVFEGSNKEGYKEDASTLGMPLNLYGRSKLLGEQFIKEIAGGVCAGCEHGCEINPRGEDFTHTSDKKEDLKYYIIRTSWLYGKNGSNFVDKMLALAKERDTIKVVIDQFGKPTYSLDLARKTKELIESNLDFGVYHVTNETDGEKGISWFDFASEIIRLAIQRGLIKDSVRVIPCTSEEFPLPAKRPKYSVLVNTKLPKVIIWQEALEDYIKNMES